VTAFDKAFDDFDRLDALMSTWKDGERHSPSQRRRPAMRPSAVSAEVREVLHASQEVSDGRAGNSM
jgi:hypothetical protein